MGRKITLIGAGLTGPLLAAYLTQHGYEVDIYERRSDMRKETISAGRSINLAMSVRGIQALKEVGIYEKIKPLTIPMKGRMIHGLNGSTHLQPYGQKEEEVIYSVSRATLNMELMSLAEETGKIRIYFNQKCTHVDLDKKRFNILNESTREESDLSFQLIIGVDGSASAVRNSMVDRGKIQFTDKPLGHGYKELTIPPSETGEFQLEPNALHIWPRGKFMLIALPNMDRSFTCTLFFPMEGETSFATVNSKEKIISLFEAYFPDSISLLNRLTEEYRTNPTGILGSVYCDPWHLGDSAVLLGDAAHAVVPFFGQGMNASFQDCTVLNGLMIEHGDDWKTILNEFSQLHVKNGHAIANMALENYIEMRDKVNDSQYRIRRKLELALENQFPDRFIPRYSMVSFHQIPYSKVYQRGNLQLKIIEALLDLDPNGKTIDRVLVEKMLN
tara:strand:- start:49 stop:1380 length:1332 start_codon:yes stop_codon:yes gene_type:complete